MYHFGEFFDKIWYQYVNPRRQGDITKLDVDAIVNAANRSLLGATSLSFVRCSCIVGLHTLYSGGGGGKLLNI